MPEEWEEAARFRDRFMARARGVGGLHHPGILDVSEIGHDEPSGMPYIAYEPVEGKDLRELTARGRRVADADIALIGAAVAEALDHAHAAGFVHGSITPASIIVGPDGAAWLIGFGIEPPPGSPTDMRGHAVGSGSYAAPEQIIGGVVDGRADLFALGLVLFEAVTGQHPFLATPPRDVRDRIVADEAPLPNKIRPETPGGFNAILFKLLQKDPSKRPARGAEVAQSLRALHERLMHPPSGRPDGARVPAPTVPAAARPPSSRSDSRRLGSPPWRRRSSSIAAVAGLPPPRRDHRHRRRCPRRPPRSPAEASERVAADIEAALRVEDFRRAERLLTELRRDAPLDERGLELGQRVRDLKTAKVERLLRARAWWLARQARWREAAGRFGTVLEVDPSYVDAQDKLDELAEHLRPAAITGPVAAGPPEPVAARCRDRRLRRRRSGFLHGRLPPSPLERGEARVALSTAARSPRFPSSSRRPPERPVPSAPSRRRSTCRTARTTSSCRYATSAATLSASRRSC